MFYRPKIQLKDLLVLIVSVLQNIEGKISWSRSINLNRLVPLIFVYAHQVGSEEHSIEQQGTVEEREEGKEERPGAGCIIFFIKLKQLRKFHFSVVSH